MTMHHDGNRVLANRSAQTLPLVPSPELEERLRELISLRGEIEALRTEQDRLLSENQELKARCAGLLPVQDRLAPFADTRMPVYISQSFRPLANPVQGRSSEKVLICSIPKAGTYLFSRVLELMGLEPTRLHLYTTLVRDYRFSTVEQFQHEGHKVRFRIPMNESLKLIQPGQFAVSHFERSFQTIDLLQDFKIVFLYREMRDAVVSYERFIAATSYGTSRTNAWRHMPDGPDKMLHFFDDIGSIYFDSLCHPVLGWFGQPGVLSLSFEEINGDWGPEAQLEAVQRLYDHCQIDGVKINASKLLSDVLGKETNTWSGARTNWKKSWNDEVERRFVEFGGGLINKRLGFGD